MRYRSGLATVLSSISLIGCFEVPSASTEAVRSTDARVLPAYNPYPVDPRVHVTDKSLDPMAAGSIRASVPNARAYVRYALSLPEQAPPTCGGRALRQVTATPT